jgi:outer membrane immunogenic protein
MKKTVTGIIASTILGLCTNKVLAQSKGNAWEGAYAQIGAGYASFMPSSQPGITTLPAALGSGKYVNSSTANNVNGPTANISLGYNYGINEKLIIGIGGTFFPGASSSAKLSFTTPSLSSTTNGSYNVKNVYNIFLSPGYVIDKDRMSYAKFGYTGATVSANAPTGSNSFPNKEVAINGFSMGVGYKQMVTQSLYLLGEVNYAIFKPASASVTTNSGAIVNTNIKGNGADLIVGVGYRF